nr:hypothetical protein [uncultured Microbacterium sp.]
MTMSRQLINLAGGLAAIVILALGILLVALPMFAQARSTGAQAVETAQTNEIYEIQVQTLRGQEVDLTELERVLADLRVEITATDLNDQVYELVGVAADDVGVAVTSVTASEPESWTSPALSGDPDAQTPPADAATPAETPVDAAEDAADETAVDTEPALPSTELDPRQVIPFTIVVTTTDAAQATRFIDALRGAERLLTVEHTVLTEEEGGFQLIVNARSLVLAEK